MSPWPAAAMRACWRRAHGMDRAQHEVRRRDELPDLATLRRPIHLHIARSEGIEAPGLVQLGEQPDVLERLRHGRMHLGAVGDWVASMLLARNARATCSMRSSVGQAAGSADASIVMLGLILSSRTDGRSSSCLGCHQGAQ